MLSQCLDFIKRYEIRDELKLIAIPAMQSLADNLRPYLMITLGFICVNFVLLLYIIYVLKKISRTR